MKQYLKNLVRRLGRLAYPQEQSERLFFLSSQIATQQEQLSRLFSLASQLTFQAVSQQEQLNRLMGQIANQSTKQVNLLGKQLALHNSSRLSRPASLADIEFKVFSQWGEDGIIDWLVSKLSPIPEIFIEFGVDNYEESNTRFLLLNRNWRGLIIDGSDSNIAYIRQSDLLWKYDLTACARFITCENINSIFEENGFLGEIGLLSIDIDGNDYWIWEIIDKVSPVIVVCEYSSVLGDIYPISIPYSSDFVRHKAHFSGQYAGASIKALTYLGQKKGYTFIGTSSSGVNAFFVRQDHLSKLGNFQPPVVSFPFRFSDTRNAAGELTYLRGIERLKLIEHLPVVNVTTGEIAPIKNYGDIYSDKWKRMMSN